LVRLEGALKESTKTLIETVDSSSSKIDSFTRDSRADVRVINQSLMTRRAAEVTDLVATKVL
jgi:hypothetical protein